MCGVAALFGFGRNFDASGIVPMTRRVSHRGPDGEGFVALGRGDLTEQALDAPDALAALGHRRLSILDLSDAGRQPMRRGPLWVVYNGEIFNYLEVREELKAVGVQFTTESDTEVLLAAWMQYGPEALQRLRGMWGFVLVDTASRQAWMCRDRMGIKPLYVLQHDQTVAVGSEIKQLAQLGPLKPRADAVAMYLATGFEDSQRTFFDAVTPVPAGTYQKLDLTTGVLDAPTPYWFPERVQATVTDPNESAHQLSHWMRESVRIHLRSDVPVGCALSGGVDSSAIAAWLSQLGADLHTFSAVFPGFALDESRYIDAVVQHTGARPNRVQPTPEDLLSDVDRFLWCHDEPVGSLSQYAAYAVARLTRSRGVPVTLNGQGGDEVLSGYWQTTFAALFARRREPLRLLRDLAGTLRPGGNPALWREALPMVRRFWSRRNPERLVKLIHPSSHPPPSLSILEMSEHDRRLYELRELTLPRLLKWDDRNFMAFAVEGRYPFLDHLVIEGCLSFDRGALVVNGWTKEPLRRALQGLLPETVVRRRGKVGFEAPQDQWLRGSLGRAIEQVATEASPLHAWVARPDVERVAATARSRRDRDAGQALVRMFFVDRWLRGLEAS